MVLLTHDHTEGGISLQGELKVMFAFVFRTERKRRSVNLSSYTKSQKVCYVSLVMGR
ncbi:hypothetical protein [Okeania sp. SIO2F5]|uniref:hypothetical protein n=1 Tax=Okeania sp. SIO2F5 TaxID=2607794 RepID=UPI00257D654A|nr:hypothetical protein [Okeania sp. SIO2F5]